MVAGTKAYYVMADWINDDEAKPTVNRSPLLLDAELSEWKVMVRLA